MVVGNGNGKQDKERKLGRKDDKFCLGYIQFETMMKLSSKNVRGTVRTAELGEGRKFCRREMDIISVQMVQMVQ